MSSNPLRICHPFIFSSLQLATFLLLSVSVQAQASADNAGLSGIQQLPTRTIDYTFLVAPVTATGDTLEFYTDTGGGIPIVWQAANKRLSLPVDSSNIQGRTMPVVDFPLLEKSATIPQLSSDYDQFVLYDKPAYIPGNTGFLGHSWFANRCWRFDYERGELSYIQSIDWAARPAQHRVNVSFKCNDVGQVTHQYPRIPVIIAGDTFKVLFDTGAMIFLSDEARDRLGRQDDRRLAGSYLKASVFDQLRSDHPEWQFIAGGDQLGTKKSDLLRVPELTIAGTTVGPVWFAKRSDRVYEKGGMMANLMPLPIHGAIGGSAFKYFTIIIDYQQAKAEFQRNTVR